MEALLKQSDINLLKGMYEEAMHAKWPDLQYVSSTKHFDFNFHYYVDDIALILNVFHDTRFGHTGVMFVGDLANPVRHSLERLKGYAFKDEMVEARAEKKDLIKLLMGPLTDASETISYQSYDTHLYHGTNSMGTDLTPIRPPNVSYVALIAQWRLKIGK